MQFAMPSTCQDKPIRRARAVTRDEITRLFADLLQVDRRASHTGTALLKR